MRPTPRIALTLTLVLGLSGAVALGASRANFERYLWGVTPSLMAWPAVAMGGGPGAFVIATTLSIVYLVDRSFARRRLLPPWYMCVALSCGAAALDWKRA